MYMHEPTNQPTNQRTNERTYQGHAVVLGAPHGRLWVAPLPLPRGAPPLGDALVQGRLEGQGARAARVSAAHENARAAHAYSGLDWRRPHAVRLGVLFAPVW